MEVVHGALGFGFLALLQPTVLGFLFYFAAPTSVFGEPNFAVLEPRGLSALATALLVFLTLLSPLIGLRVRLAAYGLMTTSFVLALCWLTDAFRPGLALAFAGLALGLIVSTDLNRRMARWLVGPRGTARRT